MDGTYFSYTVNIMAADNLATRIAWESVAVLLIKFADNIAPENEHNIKNTPIWASNSLLNSLFNSLFT